MSLKMENVCLYFSRQLRPNCQIYVEIGTVLNQQNWAGSWSVAGNLKHMKKTWSRRGEVCKPNCAIRPMKAAKPRPGPAPGRKFISPPTDLCPHVKDLSECGAS
jgi:hypothetical protein